VSSAITAALCAVHDSANLKQQLFDADLPLEDAIQQSIAVEPMDNVLQMSTTNVQSVPTIATTVLEMDSALQTMSANVLQDLQDLIVLPRSAVCSLIAMAAAQIICVVGVVNHNVAFLEMKVRPVSLSKTTTAHAIQAVCNKELVFVVAASANPVLLVWIVDKLLDVMVSPNP